MTELETDRLLIREFLASDSDSFCQHMLSEHHWRQQPVEPPTAETVADSMKHILCWQTEEPRTNYHLAALDKHSGEFVGEAALHVYPPQQLGTIGWGVTTGRVGQGIATEMCQAFLRLAFGTLNLHRVQAMCRSENHASRWIMAKIGMREEGVMRDNLFVRGEWWSTICAAILSSDPECLLHGYFEKVGNGPSGPA